MRPSNFSRRAYDDRESPGAHPRAGFSLIELLIGLTIAAILATSATMAAAQSFVAFRTARLNSSLEANVRRSLDRAVREVMGTSFSVITPATLANQFGSSDIVFQEVVDIVDDEVVWGNPRRLAFQYEDGELDDGIDNNGNGLVDEGVLVLVMNDGLANERRVVICHNVREFLEGELDDGDDDNGNGVIDEAGFNVHRVGDVLTLRLTLEEPSQQTDTVMRTLTTSIRLRN